jgi:hypothetical protein
MRGTNEWLQMVRWDAARSVPGWAEQYLKTLDLISGQPPNEQADLIRAADELTSMPIIHLSRLARDLASSEFDWPEQDDPRIVLPLLNLILYSMGCLHGMAFHMGRDPEIVDCLWAHLASREEIEALLADPSLAGFFERHRAETPRLIAQLHRAGK